jgi:predicted O-methyltransferase YrrM
MNDDILKKLTDRKDELLNLLSQEEGRLREYSQQVSKSQVNILEMRAELKGLNKILEQLNK